MKMLANASLVIPRTWQHRASHFLSSLRWPGSALPALLAAAGEGDTLAVESMLRAGADPDETNSWGQTALHLAARRGHAETAACLLRYGACDEFGDWLGRTPLSPPNCKIGRLHEIRQRHRRFRTIDAAKEQPSSEPIAHWIRELNQDGIVKLPGLIGTDQLNTLRSGFADFVRALDAKIQRGTADMKHYDEEEHWMPDHLAYVSNNALKYAPQLARLCCRPEIVELARLYMGRDAFVTRVQAMRYLPDKRCDDAMFGWHHDVEEKRFKVMVLLTDIGEQDQAMSYVVGSHRIYHSYEMFFHNECSLDHCRQHIGDTSIRSTFGEAGDVFIFDSNGAHRGTRNTAAKVRDVFFVEYCTDASDLWGADLDPAMLAALDIADASPLQPLLATDKKWHLPVTRQHPTWVENLPNVAKWRN